MANFKQLQVSFPTDTVLFKEDDSTLEMYILLAGEVVVTKNNQELAKVSESGAFLGEMATLLNAKRSATVTTTKKSVFLKILPENIDTLFKVTPELGYKLSKTLAQRLADMTVKLATGGGGGNSNVDSARAGKLSQEDVAESQKIIEKEEPVPEDPQKKVDFLTRTEVHKDIMRFYFNHMGNKIEINTLLQSLEIPDTLGKLVLKEFKETDLVEVEGAEVEFKLSDTLEPKIEEWIFDHGLFRLAV